MFFSDALPIQTYLVGQTPYNEEALPCQMKEACFIYEHGCGEEIKLQFTDTSGDDFLFKIFNSDGEELFSDILEKDFVSGSTYVYRYAFVPIDLYPNIICDEIVRIKYYNKTQIDFNSGLQYGDYQMGDIQYGAANVNDELYLVAKTDIFAISSEPSCSILIQYTSAQNFAGLIYDDYTGYFTIRIPGIFYQGRTKSEVKTIDLSNSLVINTASSLKSQRKILTKPMPDFMHLKFQLVLSHAISGSVLIDGVSWTQEESYEQEDLNELYPLKPANIYLTRKNYLQRNVI